MSIDPAESELADLNLFTLNQDQQATPTPTRPLVRKHVEAFADRVVIFGFGTVVQRPPR